MLLILRAAHACRDLCELRAEHRDLWPAGHAGDRKWSRDRADALAGRVYGREDEVQARRDRLAEWLEAHPGATAREMAAVLGYPLNDRGRSLTLWLDLAVMGGRPTHAKRTARWSLEDEGATSATRAA